MDIATMRGLVRRDLQDEDADNYRWTDNEIDRAIDRAVAELSRYAPREMKTTIATTDDSRNIDVSSLTDRLSIELVEFPVDEYPRVFQPFSVYQDTLTMAYEGDGENCYIYWSKLHTLDADTSTILTRHEPLVALGASAYAIISASQYHSDRANIGGDQVDRDYAYWGRDRLKEFSDRLKRLPEYCRLRTSTFYTE